MPIQPGVPDVRITDRQDAELASYRALAWQAVLGLIFGLLAPLAMVDPLLWAMPILGTIFSWWGLRRIKNYPAEFLGRKIALAGLTLSLLFLAAAPSDWFAYRRIVRGEARQFSALWFKYLAQDEPQKAYQFTVVPQLRLRLDDHLWAGYRASSDLRDALEKYVESPLVRTLLALGPKAQVRFYDTVGQTHQDNDDWVDQCYAVAYEEDGEKKSFFVVVSMVRRELGSGAAEWRIVRTDGGFRPEGW
jgi:hypothetical protein